MKLYKLTLLSIIFAVSCNKDNGGKNGKMPDFENIKGVRLTALDASPAGTIGTPDINANMDDYFTMHVYPTPSENMMSVYMNNLSSEVMNINLIIYNTAFPNAPTYYNGQKIKIENQNIAGAIAYQVNDILINPNNASNYQIDVSNLKSGFYRVCVRVNDSVLFWDNTWVWH